MNADVVVSVNTYLRALGLHRDADADPATDPKTLRRRADAVDACERLVTAIDPKLSAAARGLITTESAALGRR